MDNIPKEPPSFPVMTLPSSPTSRHVLVTALTQRFKRAPEWSVFCQSLHSRLNDCHDAVATHDEHWRAAYCDLLRAFVKLLRQKTLLQRLAGGESFAFTFKDLNTKLDGICVGVERGDMAGEAQWMQDWERGCEFQASKLTEVVAGSAARMLIGEMRDEQLVTKAMLDMYVWLNANIPSRLNESKQRTLERLKECLHLEARVISSATLNDTVPGNILPIFKWFIPKRDVEFIGGMIGAGSCGTVSRATWRRRDGKTQVVVVKQMYRETARDIRATFLKQLQFWSELPEHANIVKLYGGCHLEDPPFFVCDDAHGGNIVDFLATEENRGMFWELFLQVAQGLQALHDNFIIHDGLRGSNILMGANNTPKISDFNCAYIRTLSAGLSQQNLHAQEVAVRWKPREKLAETISHFPQDVYFPGRSDVYSLGMCIIEAKTQLPPFAMDEDDDVMTKVIGGQSYERPDGVSDTEWNVISQLITVAIENRPDVRKAIVLIRSLVPTPIKAPQQSSVEISLPALSVERRETLAA
ncbi:hypothetical protein PHYPSEUDO_003905 [Phytophthora pseudosyringae]|uniref:Protein kinase domain-containing protein n=1 Tax=Phytophthora pseudosyringae TaxID=221518 RepID=A0A8T1VPE1_9STRA|nr:hypothetical protein PHYPSEUDO_003905 [Phytophthora pseudosyringae]